MCLIQLPLSSAPPIRTLTSLVQHHLGIVKISPISGKMKGTFRGPAFAMLSPMIIAEVGVGISVEDMLADVIVTVGIRETMFKKL